jgi:hypothetical protein
MTKDMFDSQDFLKPLTPLQEFTLAQAAEPGVVFTYERKREKPGKEILNALVYKDRAWLYYWQVDEDENYDDMGFRSYDPSTKERPMLSIPICWTTDRLMSIPVPGLFQGMKLYVRLSIS